MAILELAVSRPEQTHARGGGRGRRASLTNRGPAPSSPPPACPHRRFLDDNIYTNVADVLVSINPYAAIPGLYEIPMPPIPSPEPERALLESVPESAPGSGSGSGSDLDPRSASDSESGSDGYEAESEPGSVSRADESGDDEGGVYRRPDWSSVAERTAALFRDYEQTARRKPPAETRVSLVDVPGVEAGGSVERGEGTPGEEERAGGERVREGDLGQEQVGEREEGKGGKEGGEGKEGEEEARDDESPEAKLSALKSLLGRPHVYGVADRAFR